MILDDPAELEAHAADIAAIPDTGGRVHVDVRAGVPRARLLDGLRRHL